MNYPFFPFKLFSDENGGYLTRLPSSEQAMHLNPSAASLLKLCNGSLSVEDIVAILANRYQKPVPEIRQKTQRFVEHMQKERALWVKEEPIRWFAPPPPQSVFWEITSECNLRCKHCVVSAGDRLPQELTTEQGYGLIQEWAEMGVGDITFSGGEPLMRHDIFQLAQMASDHGIALQLATNGTLVTPEIAAEIKRLHMAAQVSLDGSDREVYAKFRGSKKAFDQAVGGIENLLQAGVNLTVGTVLSKHNIDDIDNMLELVARLGVKHFRLIPFIPSGRGKKHRSLELDPQQVRDVTSYLAGKRPSLDFEILPMEFELTLRGPSGLALDVERPSECGGGVQYCTVTPEGDVLPCHYFSSVRADSLLRKSFRWIWDRSRFLNYFRSIRVGDIGGECSRCQWLADCRGGCRAANLSIGEMFSQNCHCWVAGTNSCDASKHKELAN